jgi:hypothetical protein
MRGFGLRALAPPASSRTPIRDRRATGPAVQPLWRTIGALQSRVSRWSPGMTAEKGMVS